MFHRKNMSICIWRLDGWMAVVAPSAKSKLWVKMCRVHASTITLPIHLKMLAENQSRWFRSLKFFTKSAVFALLFPVRLGKAFFPYLILTKVSLFRDLAPKCHCHVFMSGIMSGRETLPRRWKLSSLWQLPGSFAAIEQRSCFLNKDYFMVCASQNYSRCSKMVKYRVLSMH